MNNLPSDFETLLTLSHSDNDAFVAIHDLMTVPAQTTNPDGTLIELTNDCYYPLIMSGKFVSEDNYNIGCFYCDNCTNVVWSTYRNQYTLANCYYCVPPSHESIKIMSIIDIMKNINELNSSVDQLKTSIENIAKI